MKTLKTLFIAFISAGIFFVTPEGWSAGIQHSNAPLLDLGSEVKGHAGNSSSPSAPTMESQTTTSTSVAKAKKPKEPEKKVVHNPHWSYMGKEGPDYWGDLSPDYALCKTGKNQSPVNLMTDAAVGTTSLPGFDVHYRDTVLKVINNGHTLQVNVPLGSYIKINNHRYELMQYHFHTPSEHQLNGFNYPMELHLVHRDGRGHYIVIGILFREGKENDALQTILDHLPKKKGKQEIFSGVTFNPNVFFPESKKFFKYSGSLTTPPCSEGVYWMVFQQPVEASAEQLEKMNELMGSNARPVQNLNARSLLKSWNDPKQNGQDNRYYQFY
ncbi:carbonic anhydrase [Hydrogenovibrio kuenenii]|uniref:carbonic anhydrase n=1 Tax=Hydrogenovibrio kuenenii TaxID=63658 RepID=UPI000463F9D7|nr:carbonic anhydrase family protein [Hydrogenovibrio kuenenii]